MLLVAAFAAVATVDVDAAGNDPYDMLATGATGKVPVGSGSVTRQLLGQ